MDDSETITNGDRHKGLHYIFHERSGLIKHFKRDIGEQLFNEFSQMFFIVSGMTTWKLTRGGEQYCSEYFQ